MKMMMKSISKTTSVKEKLSVSEQCHEASGRREEIMKGGNFTKQTYPGIDKKLLVFLNSGFLDSMFDWFNGRAMDKTFRVSSVACSSRDFWTKTEYKNFLSWINEVHKVFPVKKQNIYRVVRVNPKLINNENLYKKLAEDASQTSIKKKNFVGKVVKLKVGQNIVHSWSNNLNSVRKFHKDVLNRDTRYEDIYLFVVTVGEPITNVTTIRFVLKLILTQTKKAGYYKLENFSEFISRCYALYKMLGEGILKTRMNKLFTPRLIHG